MYKNIQKDIKRRIRVKHYQFKRISLKTIQQNLTLPPQVRLVAFIQLSKMQKNSSPIKVRNRCILTGRSRGVYNYFKISRIMIRSLAAQGLLSGLKKAS